MAQSAPLQLRKCRASPKQPLLGAQKMKSGHQLRHGVAVGWGRGPFFGIPLFIHYPLTNPLFSFLNLFSLSAHHCGDRSSGRWASTHPGHRTDCYLLQVSAKSPHFNSPSLPVLSKGHFYPF